MATIIVDCSQHHRINPPIVKVDKAIYASEGMKRYCIASNQRGDLLKVAMLHRIQDFMETNTK